MTIWQHFKLTNSQYKKIGVNKFGRYLQFTNSYQIFIFYSISKIFLIVYSIAHNITQAIETAYMYICVCVYMYYVCDILYGMCEYVCMHMRAIKHFGELVLKI